MPADTPHTQKQPRAEYVLSTNQGEAEVGEGTTDPDTVRTSYVSTHRNDSTSSTVTSEERRKHAEEASGTATQGGSGDGLVFNAPRGGAPTRAIEKSIWDWDPPIETGQASYYYEPQGELLHEQRERQQSRSEFNIPTLVPQSGRTRLVTDPNSHRGFAVPRPPSGLSGASQSVAGIKRKSTSDRDVVGAGQQPEQKRLSRVMSESSGDPLTGVERPPAHSTRSQSGANTRQQSSTDASEIPQPSSATEFEPTVTQDGSSGQQRSLADTAMPMVLPARKVFPIQIGDKLFRLSGASISSDAPSYFSQFFEDQLRQNEGADNVRTLYIDRDPATFEDISLHLQGYHVEPRDGPHFVKLFADAQFFSLPRLTAQLFSSTIYIRIGDSEFQIPRDLFSNPGDSPNYFSLGFAIFFSSPSEAFPGLSQRTLLRPPSILPPSVPNRSAKTFADILHILKGYPVEIRSEEHRQELLRDTRYFHLKGLEQRLIPHKITYNLARRKAEILVRLEDIRQSGVSFVADAGSQPSEPVSPASTGTSSTPTGPGWVYYQRPYVDSEAYSLVVEINGEESTFLSVAPRSSAAAARMGRATFHKQALARVTSLFSVIANKMNLPVTQPLGLMMMERGAGVASLPVNPRNTGVSDELVKVRIGPDADVTVDGVRWLPVEDEDDDDEDTGMDVDPSDSSRATKRRRRDDPGGDEGEEWVVKKAQWRLRVQPVTGGAQTGRSGMEVILGAVKIEAYSNERARNAARGFLM